MEVYLTDGTLPTYYDNGKKSGEVTYKNSKPHGLWTEWYENGQLKSENISIREVKKGSSIVFCLSMSMIYGSLMYIIVYSIS